MVMGSLREETEVVVVGAGPGGYVAALHAADLGREVVLVEEREQLGGVCLIEGCIPSKALIHAIGVAELARSGEKFGLTFEGLQLDPDKLRAYTQSVVDGLTKGVVGLCKARGVNVVHGRARFEGDRALAIDGADVSGIDFRHCIIATGSRPKRLPALGDVEVWTSTEAVAIPEVPERLLVVGGGYIGLELGLVYAGLGSKVTVVEFFPRLLFGADPDLVRPMHKACKKRFEEILVDSKVVGLEQGSAGVIARVEHKGEIKEIETDRVLVAIGRDPNTESLGLEHTGVTLDGGLIQVDEQCRTRVPHIYAIGDVVPGAALAHKASREGKVAAEVISGQPAAFDNRAIPAVVFTDPEIVWTGLTELEAEQQNRPVNVGRFPLAALGRAKTMGRTDGLVKVIVDPDSDLVLGVGMVGPHVSELIAEATLAIEMGATLEDLMVTIHPHPTLSEALMEAAEVAAGHPIHITIQKKK